MNSIQEYVSITISMVSTFILFITAIVCFWHCICRLGVLILIFCIDVFLTMANYR
jgi:hypothetical protein